MKAVQIEKLEKMTAQKDVFEDLAHMYRVAEMSYRLAKAIGATGEVLKDIYTAAIYHDIGKNLIDRKILHKPGHLNPFEKAVMQTHPELGARIGAAMNLSKQSIRYILEHHENFDGTGYPGGLSGDSITLGGRILKICDVYDALSSDRSYRPAFPQSEVLKIMDREQATFDPQLYAKFKETIT